MKSLMPKNAFQYFNLNPNANNSEIMLAVMQMMKQFPNKMSEIAENQNLLINPGSRFLIEFLYYFDPDKDMKEKNP
jgi:hypothetical protein